jgi:hypothetical protein
LAFAHRSWGEDRLYFRGDDGRLWSIDRALTDLGDPDPFVVVSAGRCVLRMEDLVQLAEIVRSLARQLGD